MQTTHSTSIADAAEMSGSNLPEKFNNKPSTDPADYYELAHEIIKVAGDCDRNYHVNVYFRDGKLIIVGQERGTSYITDDGPEYPLASIPAENGYCTDEDCDECGQPLTPDFAEYDERVEYIAKCLARAAKGI